MNRAGLWLVFVVACCNNQKAASTMGDGQVRGDVIGEDVVLPDVTWPDDLPASRWEAYYDEALLAANGVARTPEAWRGAVTSPTAVVREGAYRLLADAAAPEDEARFRRGLDDSSTTVRAHAAYGLARLGDAAARETLAGLAAGAVEFGEYGALVAAGRLAALGDARGFAAVRAGVDQPGSAPAALPALLPFIELQGQAAGGATVDVWPLYGKALAGDDQLQSMALGAFAEKPRPAQRALLATYLAGAPSAMRRAEAEALLAKLPAE